MQENRKEEKRLRKKKNKKTVADTGYKKVDRKEKKKKEKQEEKRRQKKLSVQQSIAYKDRMGARYILRIPCPILRKRRVRVKYDKTGGNGGRL